MKTPKQLRTELKNHDKYLDAEFSEEAREELKERALRFAIDTDNLTEEVAKQPAEYAYFAHTLAIHETIRAKATLKVKLVESQIRQAIHNRDSRDGRSGGPTVSQIEAMVQNEPQYQQALVELRNAEHRVALLQADVTASAQKAAMLKLFSDMVSRETHMKGFVKDGEESKRSRRAE
jgi:hypothetical protein